MKYKVVVVIFNPDHQDREKELVLNAQYGYDEKQYGNKHFLYIRGTGGFEVGLDIRYDTRFNRNKKAEYIEQWARSYWSGKDGAYAVKSISIEEVK